MYVISIYLLTGAIIWLFNLIKILLDLKKNPSTWDHFTEKSDYNSKKFKGELVVLYAPKKCLAYIFLFQSFYFISSVCDLKYFRKGKIQPTWTLWDWLKKHSYSKHNTSTFLWTLGYNKILVQINQKINVLIGKLPVSKWTFHLHGTHIYTSFYISFMHLLSY